MGTLFRMKSCCGCSLRTGSQIIAIIDLLSALTTLVLFNKINEYRRQTCCEEASLLKVHLYFLGFTSSIVIISDIVLFIGILKEKLTLVGAWVFAYIASFFSFVVIISISAIYINGDYSCAGYWHLSEFALLYLGFKVFSVIVVRSYANSLAEGAIYYNA